MCKLLSIFISLVFVLMTSGARLEKNYLPPGSTKSAGGNGNFLQTPHYQQTSTTQSGSFAQRPNVLSNGAFPGQSGSFVQRPNVPSNGALPGQSGSFAQRPSAPSNGAFSGSSSSFAQPSLGQYNTGAAKGAAPQPAILRFNNNNNGDGTYQYDFETENGISQQEAGEVKNLGTDNEANVVQGSFSYGGDDGQTYTINYVADEYGFRPEGAHLPTAPPIPQEILKSLELNAAHEAAGIIDDGQYRSTNDPQSYQEKGAVNRQYLAPEANNANSARNGYRY